MQAAILAYNAAQDPTHEAICSKLAEVIEQALSDAESKVWHGAPVWFLDGNPIVGYWVRKQSVQLLFWSGQSFDESDLQPEGKFKAAEKHYTGAEEIKTTHLKRWLKKARSIQWDYKNLAKRRGQLEKLGDW